MIIFNYLIAEWFTALCNVCFWHICWHDFTLWREKKQKTKKPQNDRTEGSASWHRTNIIADEAKDPANTAVCRVPLLCLCTNYKGKQATVTFFISIPLFDNGQLAFWVKRRQTKRHFRHKSILIRLITAGCQQRLAPVIKNRKLLEGKQVCGACAVHYVSLNSG